MTLKIDKTIPYRTILAQLFAHIAFKSALCDRSRRDEYAFVAKRAAWRRVCWVPSVRVIAIFSSEGDCIHNRESVEDAYDTRNGFLTRRAKHTNCSCTWTFGYNDDHE